ncbi:hypothetical protein, partial [Endozoicomonas atrinae]|uniref:hypothetical protein n=1 Tax=Endozoicomonas atrinae TaxID=1333660 RepID=UPI000AB8312F
SDTFYKIDNTEAVTSVNGHQGVVSLTYNDVSAHPNTWVPSWAQVTGKPSTFTPSAHNHDSSYYTKSQTDTLLASKSDSHAHPYRADTWVPTWSDVTGKPATFTPSAHTHPISDITNLQASLDAKAASSHNHTIANVTGLQTELDGKANNSHNHDAAYYTQAQVDAIVATLQARLDALEAKTAQQSVTGTTTIFSGEVQATDISIGN